MGIVRAGEKAWCFHHLMHRIYMVHGIIHRSLRYGIIKILAVKQDIRVERRIGITFESYSFFNKAHIENNKFILQSRKSHSWNCQSSTYRRRGSQLCSVKVITFEGNRRCSMIHRKEMGKSENAGVLRIFIVRCMKG